jgi:CHAD domain-containing protein
VHEARKRFKKIRAVLRLVRSDLGASYAVENQCFRDAGRKLSALRDAEAMVETFDLLMRSGHAPSNREAVLPAREALVRRRDAIAADRASLDAPIEAVVRELRSARRRIESWPAAHRGPSGVFKGLKKSYARGRDAMAAAYQARTDEAFHDWRKRVKDHTYHIRLLRKVWPSLMEPFEEQLSELSELLGDHHNLAVFRAAIPRDCPGEGAAVESLLLAAGDFQRELERRAWPLGQRLFAEKPAAMTSRLQVWWKTAARVRHSRASDGTKPVAADAAAE